VILGVALLVLCNGLSCCAAWGILQRLGLESKAPQGVNFLLLRFAFISIAVIVGGLTHLLTPAGLSAISLLLGAAVMCSQRPRKLFAFHLPSIGWVVSVMGAILALRLLAQAWFLSPYNLDALSYHLTKIAEWIRAGAFTREMGMDTHAPFPAGFELIECWWAVFLHHDVLIELAGVEFLALGAMASFSLARTTGLGDKASAFAALTYVLTPVFSLQATACLNDAPVASLLLATASQIGARSPLALLATSLGLGIGMKGTFVYALPGLLLLGWLLRKQPTHGTIGKSWALVLVLSSVLIAGIWFTRNTLWFGNPLHPMTSAGVSTREGKTRVQFGPSISHGSENVLALIEDRVYDRKGPYTSISQLVSGWGGVTVGIGSVALAAALRSESGFLRSLVLSLTVSLAGVLFLVRHDAWFGRFVMFFPVCTSIAIGWLSEKQHGVMVVATLALAIQFVLTFAPADWPLSHFATLARISWRERSMAKVLGMWTQERAIGYLVEEPDCNRGESYLLYRPDYSCRVVYLRSTDAAGLMSELRGANVSVVYLSLVSQGRIPKVLEDCVHRGLIVQVDRRFFQVREP
jgi:hypothetical protein